MSRNSTSRDRSYALLEYLKNNDIETKYKIAKWYNWPSAFFFGCFPSLRRRQESRRDRIDKCVDLLTDQPITAKDFLFQLLKIFDLDDARTDRQHQRLHNNIATIFHEFFMQDMKLVGSIFDGNNNFFHLAAKHHLPELVFHLASTYRGCTSIQDGLPYALNSNGETPLQIAKQLRHQDFINKFNEYETWLQRLPSKYDYQTTPQIFSKTQSPIFFPKKTFKKIKFKNSLASIAEEEAPVARGSQEYVSKIRFENATPTGDPDHVKAIPIEHDGEDHLR